MNISYNWLKDYLDLKLPADEVAAILTDCGLEVEGVEKVESIQGGLKGLVVGQVISCEKHPNADKLKITKVDIGAQEELPIVCGAPNVAAGQKVVVATVGTIIYPLGHDPLKIKKAKIRGEVSEGMICAEDEIGLGTSHDGIMILDQQAKIGLAASDYFDLKEDHVFEIGLTPNRADAMSHFGVARDLLAVLKCKGHVKADHSLKDPRDLNLTVDNHTLNIELDVQNSEACPRYAGICLSNVEVKDSPDWLKQRLQAIGLKPINNIVDVTNFILHDMGQPLHAFDYDKIEGNKVVVRSANSNSSFVSLDEEKRTMTDQDLMICHSNDAMCIAGVFGGLHSGVTSATKNIFLESAYFDPVYIRKTAKRQGLNTDASFRFERGIDPNITVEALKAAVNLMKEVSGCQVTSEIVESYPAPISDHQVEINLDRCTKLIGQNLEKTEIIGILESLDIEIIEDQDQDLKLKVPAYRVDVRREADIVEEILRIYGYNQINMPEKMAISINPAPRVDQEALRHRISDLLVSIGFAECMSNSLSSSKDYASNDSLVNILNPLSSELDVMRNDMVHDILDIIRYNHHHRNTDLKIFEFGKSYSRNENSISEKQHLVLAVTGSFDDQTWNSPNRKSDFYILKSQVIRIFESLGILSLLKESPIEYTGVYEDALTFKHKKNVIASIGLISKSLRDTNEIETAVYYADINWDYVVKLCLNHEVSVQDIPKYQEVRRDLALLLNKEVKFEELKKLALEADDQILREVNLFDVYEGKNLPSGKKSYALTYLLRDDNKTLTDERVDKVIKKIFNSYQEKLGVELRSGQL